LQALLQRSGLAIKSHDQFWVMAFLMKIYINNTGVKYEKK